MPRVMPAVLLRAGLGAFSVSLGATNGVLAGSVAGGAYLVATGDANGMDSAVLVALIVAIPTTIASIGTIWIGLRNSRVVAVAATAAKETKVIAAEGVKAIDALHTSTNSKMDQLLEIATRLARAEGRAEGKAEAEGVAASNAAIRAEGVAEGAASAGAGPIGVGAPVQDIRIVQAPADEPVRVLEDSARA